MKIILPQSDQLSHLMQFPINFGGIIISSFSFLCQTLPCISLILLFVKLMSSFFF